MGQVIFKKFNSVLNDINHIIKILLFLIDFLCI